MSIAYNPYLVALSVAVATFASYTALDLAGRSRAQSGTAVAPWLVGAACAMGGGIWSMHFIGMLAVSLPVTVRYDVGITLLSLATPIAMTSVGFFLVSKHPNRLSNLVTAGLITGASISSMHYIGMAAMRMDAELHHGPLFVLASVAIAVGAATAALWLSSLLIGRWRRIAAAPIMGLAVSGMHYMAMAGVHIVPIDTPTDTDGILLDPPVMAFNLATVNLLVMILALAAATYDRRLARLNAAHARTLEDSNEILEAKVRERTRDLEKALDSRNLILRELQHRVRNNLQVVKSLLRLQARQFEDPRVAQAFVEAQNRVQSIALVHTLLFDHDGLPSIVHFDTYLKSLCAELARTYDAERRQIAIKVAAADIALPLETAVPAGLMINELVSNAFKHAFPVGSGQVRVEASLNGAYLTFTVADNGVGFAGPTGTGKDGHVGMRVISSLAAQLDGTIEFRTRNGTEAVFTQIPLKDSVTL
jgi:NO-binding membrane sensor protein with MHYT domain/two-component sensor histidine kinase